MLKQLSFISTGRHADIGSLQIFRILPNRYALAVGSFVFLDYFPILHEQSLSATENKETGAHPHRGIATLTYLLSGSAEHFDSFGNNATVHSGGAQWMNAGNGIIHNEKISIDPLYPHIKPHGFQFWINMPAKIKLQSPEYISFQNYDIPRIILPNEAGYLKVIVGEYLGLVSIIPQYLPHFLYHIHLNQGQSWSISIPKKIECALFLVNAEILVNGQKIQMAEFAEFDREFGEINIQNNSNEAVDLLFFGGETYTEPIIAEGPFVMNSKAEIALAYKDYFAGKYGEIKY
jgi:redox-sensitive bicupin YhaK (pirin superfamily)